MDFSLITKVLCAPGPDVRLHIKRTFIDLLPQSVPHARIHVAFQSEMSRESAWLFPGSTDTSLAVV